MAMTSPGTIGPSPRRTTTLRKNSTNGGRPLGGLGEPGLAEQRRAAASGVLGEPGPADLEQLFPAPAPRRQHPAQLGAEGALDGRRCHPPARPPRSDLRAAPQRGPRWWGRRAAPVRLGLLPERERGHHLLGRPLTCNCSPMPSQGVRISEPRSIRCTSSAPRSTSSKSNGSSTRGSSCSSSWSSSSPSNSSSSSASSVSSPESDAVLGVRIVLDLHRLGDLVARVGPRSPEGLVAGQLFGLLRRLPLGLASKDHACSFIDLIDSAAERHPVTPPVDPGPPSPRALPGSSPTSTNSPGPPAAPRVERSGHPGSADRRVPVGVQQAHLDLAAIARVDRAGGVHDRRPCRAARPDRGCTRPTQPSGMVPAPRRYQPARSPGAMLTSAAIARSVPASPAWA